MAKIVIPSLISTTEFQPTPVMQKFAIAYISDKEGLSPNQILKSLGHSEQLWYQWKAKPQFLPWLQRVANDYLGTVALIDVHKAVYREAIRNSAQDRKLYLERFDADYKPASRLDIDAWQGQRPPDSPRPEEAVAESKRWAAEVQARIAAERAGEKNLKAAQREGDASKLTDENKLQPNQGL